MTGSSAEAGGGEEGRGGASGGRVGGCLGWVSGLWGRQQKRKAMCWQSERRREMEKECFTTDEGEIKRDGEGD